MKYLLDTNAVIALMKGDGVLLERLRRQRPTDCGLPSVVVHELYYGAFRSRRPDHHLARIEALRFEVLDFSPEDARRAGQVRARLAAVGQPVGPYDALIAGQALARDLILVTHNLREFERIEGLVVEDWQAIA